MPSGNYSVSLELSMRQKQWVARTGIRSMSIAALNFLSSLLILSTFRLRDVSNHMGPCRGGLVSEIIY